jgi:multiple sugar transport system substrate-binding protein
MRRTIAVLIVTALLGLASAQTTVRWFVGLGAGSDEPTFEAQRRVVDEFNASQNDIRLVLEIVDNDNAYDVLATQIAAGNAPDIVGPMGIRGRAAFPGAWLDLQPLIDSNDYDLSDFDPALVDFYRLEDGGQLGIPFAVFPSYLSYNVDLFDEAGLEYPPAQYGETYVLDGEEVEWNLETLSEVARRLTVDTNGVDATAADFDRNDVVQWGFGIQWTDLRGRLTLLGPGNFVDDDGNAVIPDHWREAAQWHHDAMWKHSFYPSGPYGESELLGAGNWFESGNLAMAQTHLWYAACCMGALRAEWNAAALPSYHGEVTAKLHADTFGILRSSRNPDAAFEVLTHLLSPEMAGRMAAIYGGMPARLSLQDQFLTQFNEQRFPGQDINWDVVVAGLSHPDNPNHEEGMPNFLEAETRYNAFVQLLENEPDLDVDSELDLVGLELQLIFETARR